MSTSETVYNADVLIIGGGLAGCLAAIKARDNTEKVILVDKAKVSRSGASSFGTGGVLFPTPEDDLELWAEELVERGDYINDQDWVQVLLKEQYERVKELESWGVNFERDEKGQIFRMIGRANRHTRMAVFSDKQSLMEVLRKKIVQKGVILVERTMITDLLTSDARYPTSGEIVGALGFDVRKGSPAIFKAKAVVVSTGGGGHQNLFGDGIAMAYRAGAEISGMEFASLWGNWIWDRKYSLAGMNLFQNAGLIFTNSQNKRFMAEYFPELKERARTQDIGLAIGKEGVEGRGPIYSDMTHFSEETIERFRRAIPLTMLALDREGIDLRKRKLIFDVQTGVLHLHGSGIRTNVYCETSLPGLFAAGQAGGYPAHGTYSVGGVNLALCCVSGHRAGLYASLYSKNSKPVSMNDKQTKLLIKRVFEPLQRKSNLNPDSLKENIMNLLSQAENSFFRHEKRINNMLHHINPWKEELSATSARDFHELAKCHEIGAFLDCLELLLSAASYRKESRGLHIREDYPFRDDINWLKWIIFYKDEGQRRIRTVPVPMYRYPVKIGKYEKVPLPISIPYIEANEK